MPSKSIRQCLEAYVSKHPTISGKESLLTRFDSVVSKGINEFQAARDIILDEHKSLYISLNGVKAKAGINIVPYNRPGEADIASINESVDEKKNKSLAEIEKVHQEEMDKIEEKRKKKEADRHKKAKEKEDKVKELKQKEQERELEAEKDKEKQVKREPTKYQQTIKAIIDKHGHLPGFNEGTAEKIYRATRRIKGPDMIQEEIEKIIREARVAAEIKEKKATTQTEGLTPKAGDVGTSALRNEPGEVRPTDADIMVVEGFETILKATSDWEGNPRKDLNASANRTIGEAVKELKAAGVEISEDAMAALENKNEVDEGVDTNNNTYLFDLMTNGEASMEQRGMAAALIAAHRLSVGRTWLATAYREAGKSISVISSDNPASNILSASDRGKVIINAYKMGVRLNEQTGEKKFFNWLEMALYEEVMHLATFKVATEEEIAQIGKELSPRERQVVESIYGSKLNDWNAGVEYIRQIMQHNLFGTTTELMKLRGGGERMSGAMKELFSKMLKFIKDIFSKDRFPNETLARDVVKRMEDYLGITNPNDRFRTPKQVLAEQPKLTVHEMIEGEKPVMMFSDRNRQYLIQERKIQSGRAWFEMEQAPDGTFVPVNYGPHEIPGLLGYTFAEAQQALMGRGGRGAAGASDFVTEAQAMNESPQFDINSVFSQELTDKAISYAKDFTKKGSDFERLPPAAEQGRRSSGSINAEATIITSAVSSAAKAFRQRAQERLDFAVDQSFIAAREWLAEFNVNRAKQSKLVIYRGDKPGQLFNDDIEAALKLPNQNAALKRVAKYREEVQSLSTLIQQLPLRTKYAQEAALLQYAKENGHLIQDEDFTKPADTFGSESSVYSKPEGFVTKVMTPVFHASWSELFDRIALYNFLFPGTKLTIKGFYNFPGEIDEDVADNGNLRIVLQQPFVIRHSRYSVLSNDEIANELVRRGFNIKMEEGFVNEEGVSIEDVMGHRSNAFKDAEGNIQFIDPIIRYRGKINEDYLGNVAGASDGFGPEMTDEERRRLEAEIAADIVQEFGNSSAIKGDPIRDFQWPVDQDNKIIQDALMTMLKRDPSYQANTLDWERSSLAMKVAQANMENLIGGLFAKYDFDDVISYIIESLRDPTLELAIRGELSKVVMARIMYTHPDIVNVIREKIYPEIAKESAKTLLALKDQSDAVVDKRRKPALKKPKPGRNIIDVQELFSHDKQSQEMAQILRSVEGGQQILDQMVELNNRMRAHLVTTEEEEILGMMAEEADKERNLIRKRAEKTKELVEHMESKIQKFSEEEKKGAKSKADFVKYRMMARRNLSSIEGTFKKMKETISKISKEC